MDQFAAQKHRPGHAAAVARADDRGRDASAAATASAARTATRSRGRAPTSPLPMQNNPQVVFERLFGDGSTDAERRGRGASSRSACSTPCSAKSSCAAEQAAGGRPERGSTSISATSARSSAGFRRPRKQASTDLSLPDARRPACRKTSRQHIKLMFDLQVLALAGRHHARDDAAAGQGAEQRRSTRRAASATRSTSSRTTRTCARTQDRFAVLNRYHVEPVRATCSSKLQAIPDGDGTLLDHSMVLYGSAMSDGNQHNHGPLPIVLAGGASGTLKGGRHIRQHARHDDVEPAAGDARQARRARPRSSATARDAWPSDRVVDDHERGVVRTFRSVVVRRVLTACTTSRLQAEGRASGEGIDELAPGGRRGFLSSAPHSCSLFVNEMPVHTRCAFTVMPTCGSVMSNTAGCPPAG